VDSRSSLGMCRKTRLNRDLIHDPSSP
jgi:hypothetical protein